MTTLEELPARVDALGVQISQLREEMHDEFSAIRSGLHYEIRGGDEGVIKTLREEIRAGNDEVMAQARVLYEDMRSDLALIKEGLPRRRKRG